MFFGFFFVQLGFTICFNLVPSLTEDPTPLAENQKYPDFECDQFSLIATPTPSYLNTNIEPIFQLLATPNESKIEKKIDLLEKSNSSSGFKTGSESDISIKCNIDTSTPGLIRIPDINESSMKPDQVVTVSPKLFSESMNYFFENQNNTKNSVKSLNDEDPRRDHIQKSELPTTAIKISKNQEWNRMGLQLLDLKKNYDSPKISENDRTPGQDLLEWCKDIMKNYKDINVTNLTTSWRNGMAFCAIIHSFQPNLM